MSSSVELGTVFKGSSSGHVVAAQGETVPVPDDGVVIALTHAGLCGTDLHMLTNADMVLGHEPVGIVEQVGKAVQEFKKGDRVGFGYVSDACLSCRHCVTGHDTRCDSKVIYGSGNKHQAAFGDRAVVRAPFVHRVPDDLALADAAPLQCGGATVYGALVHAGVQPIDRVGIIGIGGLGHLAIQYARAMGTEVTVFSGSDSKRAEATKLGAHRFVALKDTRDLAKAGVPKLDHLIISTSAVVDWAQYLPVLNAGASITNLTVDDGDFRMKNMAIIGKELRIFGSFVAERPVHRDMLEFTARHGIRPMIEVLPLTEEGINEGIRRLKQGDVRYRFVFENPRNKHLVSQ